MPIAIAAIYRYPVKGLSAEKLQSAALTPGRCLPYDRRFAVALPATRFDPKRPEWLSKTHFVMLMRDEKLARLHTRFDGETDELTVERDGTTVLRERLGDAEGRRRAGGVLAEFLAGAGEGPGVPGKWPGGARGPRAGKAGEARGVGLKRLLPRRCMADSRRWRAHFGGGRPLACYSCDNSQQFARQDRGGTAMAYDVLIRNGRIVDGSGMPAFHGDVGVKDGKIVEMGKLSGAAGQTVDVEGRVISPGFIDNHCHYDAQVTWDPLCSFSCDHGATSVVIGNCSLSLAPVKKGKEKRMAEFLSYVEAIPMEVLGTVEVDWESFSQYMDKLDRNLGFNVGTLIGHTAVRYYVMDDECQKRTATDDELTARQGVVLDGMEAGALGLSVSRDKGHYDPQGVHIPALWADEKEIFAIADVLREMGTGIIQSGGGRDAELGNGLMAWPRRAPGRPVVYNNLGQ